MIYIDERPRKVFIYIRVHIDRIEFKLFISRKCWHVFNKVNRRYKYPKLDPLHGNSQRTKIGRRRQKSVKRIVPRI